MPGLMSGIEAARRALITHQMRLGVISHNIANAATPGYSRQELLVETTPAFRDSRGYLGTGVVAASIIRHRDVFFDARALVERSALGQYDALRSGMQQVESVLADLNDVGVGARLADFWRSWNELANRPTDTASRNNVITATRSLAGSLRNTRSELDAVRTTYRAEIAGVVSDINRLSAEAANLNRVIREAEVIGQPANDLRDERDRLVEQLAGLSGATITTAGDGQLTVQIGGRFLVDGSNTMELLIETSTDPNSVGGPAVWADGREINSLGGTLGGYLEARDGTIVDVIERIDQFAALLIQEVNDLHDDGSGSFNIFSGTDARDIAIGSSIANDPSAIRAGVGAAGDNSIALAIAELEHTRVADLANVSFNDYLATMVGNIGSRTREAEDLAAAQELVIQQVDNVRHSISEVSLDEEAAEMIMAQRAFQAAAQVIDTLDSMLETVILSIVR